MSCEQENNITLFKAVHGKMGLDDKNGVQL
jgi:hypothetical protein